VKTIKHQTKGTCSKEIHVQVDGDVIHDVKIIGGCPGNGQGVAKLAKGRKVAEVIALLEGIPCRNGTSCPDQLAQALKTKGG
jgi:uncharacterized protein (TIGR03905 family)